MTNKPSVEVVATPHFAQMIKRLRKKYPHIQDDLTPIINALQSGETPGDQLQGVGAPIFKVRAPNRDSQSGKSGGYRVIYYLKTKMFVFLIDVYTKTERQDINAAEIKSLLDELRTEEDDRLET